MNPFLRLLCTCLVVGLSSSPARAQVGVYAGPGAARLTSDTNWIYGPGFGMYVDGGHLLVLSSGFDLRGVVLGAGTSTQFYAGYIGPRVVLHPRVSPLNLYVEGLLGGAHTAYRGNGGRVSSRDFIYMAVAGLDCKVVPRVDWRIAEFSFGGVAAPGGTVHPKTLSTGLVIRFPNVF